jgi:putative transposase
MKSMTRRNLRQSQIASIHSLLSGHEVQDMLMERAKTAALGFGVELLEQDVNAMCGSPFARKGESLCHRGGSEKSSLIIDGARYRFRRPRVRNDAGEAEIPMLKKLRDQDLLDEQILGRMINGVSTRNYEGVIGGYAKKLGVSKSSASRAFIRASQKSLEELRAVDLSQFSFVGLMIDGVEIAGRTVVGALGITQDLRKIPLDVREGDTENSELVKDLLVNIKERGFTLHCQKLLAILDGAKALKKAVRDVFGERVIIQRCWLHKLRNLKKYTPDENHPQLYWRMKKLMGLTQYEDAQKELKSIEHWLSNISQDAASSVREVGEELITVHRLGLTGNIRKSLSTTNAIESLIGVVRDKTGRVKNWKSKKTNQILRWVGTSMRAHQSKMRRLRGYKQNQSLIQALGGVVEKKKKLA